MVHLGTEGPVALPVQNRDVAVSGVRNGQVELAVAVEVGGGDREGIVPDRVVARGPEATAALPDQHGDVVVLVVDDCDVGATVRVESADREATRGVPDRE